MAGFLDDGNGGEFTGNTFAAIFNDSSAWGDTGWKGVTVDLVGSSTWSVTSFRVARLPFRVSADSTNRPFRYIVMGQIPAGASTTFKVRVTNGGSSITTTNDALNQGSLAGTLTYASSTFSHTPNGSPIFQLLGIWDDGTNIPKLGWKPIGSAASSTSESDALFRPSVCSGRPAFAMCVQVADVNSSDAAKNCYIVRLASQIV